MMDLSALWFWIKKKKKKTQKKHPKHANTYSAVQNDHYF